MNFGRSRKVLRTVISILGIVQAPCRMMVDFCKPLQCATLCNSNTRPQKRALKYLQTSFHSLSPEEQQRVDRDLHGMEEPIEETTAFINDKIRELQEELVRVDDRKKTAYNQAMAKSAQCGAGDGTEYINCPQNFCLMFLRAERFNVKKTAKRLVLYFKEKLELFGYDKLECKIKQRDLSEQDLATLYRGAVCITGATDKFGRLIVIARRQQLSSEPVTNLRRAVFYLMQNALEDDEETQKRGLVGICFHFRKPGPQQLRHTSQVRRIFPLLKTFSFALPNRVAATHECYNDLSYHFYLSLGLMALPEFLLPRMVCHYGTQIDCMCELLEYGIDVDTLPISLQGDFQHEMVHNYLHARRFLEEGGSDLEGSFN